MFIVFKRKWWLLTIFLVTIFSALFYLFILREDLYQATAKVLVKLGQEQAVPTTVLGDRPNIIANRIQDVNSEVDILNSAQLLEGIVERLGLDKPSAPPPRPTSFISGLRYDVKQGIKSVKTWYKDTLITLGVREALPPRDAARWMLERGVKVEAKAASNVIAVHLIYPGREEARFILNKILDSYLEFRLKIFQDASAVEFFTEQRRQSLDELTRAQDELHQFERRHGITNFAEQKSVLLRQIAQAQTDTRHAKIELDEAESKVGRLDKELAKPNPDFAAIGQFSPNSFPANLQQEMAALQRQREQLRMVELDDSVRIENNRDQFKALMALTATHLRSVLTEKEHVYESQKTVLVELEASLRDLHDTEVVWQSLVRDAKISEQDYLFNQDKLQEASAIVALGRKQVGGVSVIQRAVNPLLPVGVSKSILLALALVFGVLAAGSWAVLAEFFDHGVYTSEAIEKHLHAPVVTVVPVHKRLDYWRRHPRNVDLILESATDVERARGDH